MKCETWVWLSQCFGGGQPPSWHVGMDHRALFALGSIGSSGEGTLVSEILSRNTQGSFPLAYFVISIEC